MYIRLTFVIFIFFAFLAHTFADQPGTKILKITNGIENVDNLDELIDDLLEKRIVYIGEVHDKLLHHEAQLEIIKSLYAKNNKIAIGMEMFQEDFQGVINRYLSGEISEEVFLKNTEYESRWGFDYKLYKPIVDFAKVNGIPLVALSINSDIIGKISDNGLINLDSADLNRLPESIDFTDSGYKSYLMDIFSEHPKNENSDFNKFYNIQVIWDESMADNIDRFLSENNDRNIIVLAGQGHIVYSYGIPSRVHRRNKLDYTTILNDSEHKKGISDYVIYSKSGKFH